MEIKFSSCLEAALELEELGISVIPLRPRSKSPAIAWRQYTERRATRDEINSWFVQHPDWNLGIVCGAVSGIAVVDIDGVEGEEWFKEHGLERSCLWQVTSGPHKCHMLYKHPGKPFIVRPSVDTTVKVDIRGDGSQIVCAPSIHPNGKQYKLGTKMSSLKEALENLPLMPGIFVESSSDKLYATTPNSAVSVEQSEVTTLSTAESIPEGGRNSTLTSMCGSWYGRGLDPESVFALATHWNRVHCDPPLPMTEVETIVMSMRNTHTSKNPGLLNTDGVAGWVKKSSGEFSVNDLYRDFSVNLARDKNQIRTDLSALCRQGVIEQVGDRNGVYRKCENALQHIDLFAGEGEEVRMWLPFGLDKSTAVYSGNVILVAGETNSGKTSLLLNIVARNWQHKVRYLSSEMTNTELRNRLLGYNIPLEDWQAHCEFIQRNERFADAIDPDAINVIDYLELNDEFYKANKYISEIFRKLNRGIAIVALQKKKGDLFGRGGEFSLEKPRLGISLFAHGHTPDGVFGSAVITKAKNIRTNNPQGKEIFWRLRNGVYYDTTPLASCPSIRNGLSFYTQRERKKVLEEIENYCVSAQRPDDDGFEPLEEF